MSADAPARYADSKADYCRLMARHKPDEAEFWRHAARLFDAMADEFRLGLHEKETPDADS